jgi:hypothetical protein
LLNYEKIQLGDKQTEQRIKFNWEDKRTNEMGISIGGTNEQTKLGLIKGYKEIEFKIVA